MVRHYVYYRRGAFEVEYNQNGDISWRWECQLGDAVQRAIKSVNDGQWIIYEKRVGFRGDDIMVELLVTVPAGPDQRDQLHAAVTRFEELAAEYFGTPANTAFRYIEPPTCIKCGEVATHVRVQLRDGRLEEKKYFCDRDTQQQREFETNHAYPYVFSWEQLDPASA